MERGEVARITPKPPRTVVGGLPNASHNVTRIVSDTVESADASKGSDRRLAEVALVQPGEQHLGVPLLPPQLSLLRLRGGLVRALLHRRSPRNADARFDWSSACFSIRSLANHELQRVDVFLNRPEWPQRGDLVVVVVVLVVVVVVLVVVVVVITVGASMYNVNSGITRRPH